MNYTNVSREITYILRHHPEDYDLELDDKGFVNIDLLLEAINKRKRYKRDISIDDINYILSTEDKRRWEIVDDKIRAYYGHSFSKKILYDVKEPPAILYHGTYNKVVDKILVEGLRPMKRQYVHLSEGVDLAIIVGKRRDKNPVLLKVDAKRAYDEGVVFYASSNGVWLVDELPGKYLSICEN